MANSIRCCSSLGLGPWLLFCLNFAASFAYHMVAVLFVIYATDEFGMSDVEAGLLYGWWGIISSAWAGFFGLFVIDKVGVKRLTVFGITALAISRMVMGLTTSILTLKLMVVVFSPVAEGVLAPVYMVGVKKLTSEENRPMAYSLLYAFHNAGGGLSDILIDVLRHWHDTDPFWWQSLAGDGLTPARACLLSSAFILALSVVLAFALPRSLKPALCHKYKEFHDDKNTNDDHDSSMSSLVLSVRTLLGDRNLGRVCLVATCLVLTKMLWHHMNATLPKYLVRELGEDVPWGSINSINYFMCATTPPLLAKATASWGDVPAILAGSFLMSVSPVFMTLEVSIRASCAWLILMSIGEVIWSPRFNTFTANLSPNGREGTFLVLAYFPQFFGALPTGWLSGKLLAEYCPDCPDCREADGGAFCRVNCLGLVDTKCNATLALDGSLWCTSYEDRGSCWGRQWNGIDTCPSSCRTCPGWSSRADGPTLWIWISAISIAGPCLLFLFRRILQPQGQEESKHIPQDESVCIQTDIADLDTSDPAPTTIGDSKLDETPFS